MPCARCRCCGVWWLVCCSAQCRAGSCCALARVMARVRVRVHVASQQNTNMQQHDMHRAHTIGYIRERMCRRVSCCTCADCCVPRQKRESRMLGLVDVDSIRLKLNVWSHWKIRVSRLIYPIFIVRVRFVPIPVCPILDIPYVYSCTCNMQCQ